MAEVVTNIEMVLKITTTQPNEFIGNERSKTTKNFQYLRLNTSRTMGSLMVVSRKAILEWN